MKSIRRFFSRWQNWFSFLLILLYFAVAIEAPRISPDDVKAPGPFKTVGRRTEGSPLPPDEKAPLGMLPHGVDVFHALVWGARDALRFGLIVAVASFIFGTVYGAVAGMLAGRTGGLLMNIADSFLAFPVIAGVIFLQQLYAATIVSLGGMYFNSQYLGQVVEIVGTPTALMQLLQRIDPLVLTLIIFSWMPYARIVYSLVQLLTRTEFVQAARALGGNPLWVVRKHLIPNVLSPALVLAARDVGGVVLLQATLTFIGVGGGSIWGAMLSSGRDWIVNAGGALFTYWWVFLPPTLAVILFGVAWNIFGDGLNDALDPRAL